ncbi:putative Rhomboid-related protein 3 [Hypsibius exemplaris]|uniref:rhomboid protease n=1 Tax=Hypsibius exemplaris TaxID=2072580 RepID=A0A9X6NG20_HYPEX|nr:putative Rhomboid-related protein 3 [Hypsibius exemplaris]
MATILGVWLKLGPPNFACAQPKSGSNSVTQKCTRSTGPCNALDEKMEYYGRGNKDGRLELNEYQPDWEFEHRYLGAFHELKPDEEGRVKMRQLNHKLRNKDLGLPEHIRDDMLRRADMNHDGYLDFHEFLRLIELVDSHAHLDRFHKAVALASYVVVPESERPQFVESELRHYNCCPPPLFMILISLTELALSLYTHFTLEGGMTMAGGVDRNGPLIYSPFRRKEAWRLLTYMLIHAGWTHLIVNLAVQFILGIPLELVHKYWRVAIVYLLGVVAGSLGTSVTDPKIFIVGASGGVYALIAAHLASIVINWKEMEYNWIRLVFWILLVGADVGVAVYYKHFYDGPNPPLVGYTAHFCGAVCGFLMGVVCLRNLHKLKWEQILWWICLAVTILLFAFAVFWNIFWPGFPPQKV